MFLGIGGPLSSGKSNYAMFWIDYYKARGKRVISNVQLFGIGDYLYLPDEKIIEIVKNGMQITYINERQKYFEKWFGNAVFFVDEITNLINARKAASSLNELMLNFFTMCGKLDCHIIATYQVQESQVDKVIREICSVTADCMRLGEQGQPLIIEDRFVDQKVWIWVTLEIFFGKFGSKTIELIFDPEPYYSYFNSKEVVMLNRAQYLSGGSKDLRK